MFLYSHWCSLPLSVRHKLAAQFNIPKKGPTEVFDNQIKSDGYAIKDIEERINLVSLQVYLGTKETDTLILWTQMVDKIEGRPLTQVNIDTTIPYGKFDIKNVDIEVKEDGSKETKIKFNSHPKGKKPGRKPKTK